MIDYSVFMMGNPMDVDAAQKAYAKAQVSEIVPLASLSNTLPTTMAYSLAER